VSTRSTMRSTRTRRLVAAALGLGVALSALTAGGRAAADDSETSTDERARSGGATTVFVTNQHAFGKSAANLPIEDLRDFAFGNRLFNTNWVTAPASVESFDGLGPLFNRVSCSGCHVRDGRGRPPDSPDAPWTSMLVRLSVPGEAPDGGPRPHPVYGGQLQDRAIRGIDPEGRPSVSYETFVRELPDGTRVELRRPVYAFADLRDGPLGDDVLFSPRVAPAIHGLGLLEAVAAADLLARADPEDADGDGISGRPNRVIDVAAGERVLGRFGWKANQPSLRQQAAGAFNGDVGITTTLFAADHVTEAQRERVNAPSGGDPELPDADLDRLVFYLQALAVPARRGVDDPAVRRGERLFAEVGCASCHTPTLETRADASPPHLAGQTIHPYTDLLLHDMGEGLADGRPDFEATGREWRTPPLWGLGLQEVVNGHTMLLHDGRARSALEAILWHDGEAAGSRERFEVLSAEERAALLAFLDSL